MKRSTARPAIRSRLFTMLAATALVGLLAPSVLAATVYATVTGHQAHSNEANAADFWGDNCTKNEAIGNQEVDTFVLTENYALVVVKSGSGEFANTLFANASAGETVWADTNGNNAFDEDDHAISHIIFCAADDGSLEITKDVNGGPAGFSGSFDVHVDCGEAGEFDRTITFPDPGSVTIDDLADGAECTVTETGVPDAPAGFEWGDVVITGSPATIESNETASVTVTNTLEELPELTGSLEITKVVSGGPADVEGTFGIRVTCTDTDPINTEIVFPDPGSVTINDLPAGAECLVLETSRSEPPAGFNWAGPLLFGPVTIEAGETAELTVTNLLTAQQDVPTLTIEKSNNAPIVDDNPTAEDGDTVTFTLAYTVNDGPVDNATITDVIPAGLTYVSGTASSDATFTFAGYDSATRTLSWTAASVSTSGSVTYQATVDEGAAELDQPLVNVATIDSDDTEPDSDESDVFVPAPVAGETDDNVPTAPSTDVLGSSGTSTPGLNLGLVLAFLAIVTLAIAFVTPTPSALRGKEPPPLTSASP